MSYFSNLDSLNGLGNQNNFRIFGKLNGEQIKS